MISLAARKTSAHAGEGATRQSAVERRYRPELQGLRALAVVLVIVYHVWSNRVSGGVDVFFVISGFLVTGQLVRAAGRGRIDFRPMWGRMIKRLFPAAMTVLLVTAAACVVLLPQTRWLQTIREIGASALYLENWSLAIDSVDYYAQNDTSSVVQHFWSLSIQGQFYLVWPLLVALVAVVARLAGKSLKRTLFVVLLGIFAASLSYSVWLTRIDQPFAYFDSLTRIWEFALGGLVMLGLHALVLTRRQRLVLGWAGVLALPVCGLVTHVGSQFPGYLALWPTLCAAAVIVAGATESRWGADRLLSLRPVAYIGDLSYALYLWHWPVLVLYLVTRDRTEVGLRGGLMIVAVSVVLAVLTHHLVENPVRESQIGVKNRWGAYRLGVATMAAVLLAVTAWQLVSVQKAESYAIAVDDPDHPGAQAHTAGFEYWGAENPELMPPLVSLPNDWARRDGETCKSSSHNEELRICTAPTQDPPTRKVVLVGDSHAGQWLAALQPIAQRHNWELTVMSRGGCAFSTESEFVPGDQSCLRWTNAATAEILDLHPDAVFTMATMDVRPGLTEKTPKGFTERWRELDQAGIPVLAVRDNPRFDYSPPECATTHGPNAPQCGTPRSELLAPQPPYRRIPGIPGNVSFLDFSDYFCTPEVCGPVVGNVLVYMDFNHPSATFMTTMSPVVEPAVLAALKR
jgi:peptidoglycan/LPS O-acetylase OafA/YrhL